MAPAFTKLLGSGEIAEYFQDKLPTEATLTAMQQMLKLLALIKAWTVDLQAEDRPTAQVVIPAMVQLCNLTKAKCYRFASKSMQGFGQIFEEKLKRMIEDYGCKLCNNNHQCSIGTNFLCGWTACH